GQRKCCSDITFSNSSPSADHHQYPVDVSEAIRDADSTITGHRGKRPTAVFWLDNETLSPWNFATCEWNLAYPHTGDALSRNGTREQSRLTRVYRKSANARPLARDGPPRQISRESKTT